MVQFSHGLAWARIDERTKSDPLPTPNIQRTRRRLSRNEENKGEKKKVHPTDLPPEAEVPL